MLILNNDETCRIVIPSPVSEVLKNLKRSMTMLNKTLHRVVRNNYHDRSQYPEIFFEIENTLNSVSAWIDDYKNFAVLHNFSITLCVLIQKLTDLISQLIIVCKPANGKKRVSKEKQIKAFRKTIDNILENIAGFLEKIKMNSTDISIELEKWLKNEFKVFSSKVHEICTKISISKRGNKTYVFPCADRETYIKLVNDKKRFRAEIVDKLNNHQHATGHKQSCKNEGKYKMIGFRSKDRKTISLGGKMLKNPIRMVQCLDCGVKISLIPSFLPREKHFEIDIIGNIFRGILLFSESIQDAMQNLKINSKIVSKQTIYNWLRWIGTIHPSVILDRAGVKGSGYFQEDEGFEKEPGLRTYTVVLVDPENMLVWHADYVDHVDEKTLFNSFENFCEHINFKVLGVTKDKWQPSTNALRSVFYRIWIGYCHRHCLKKFRQCLLEYQKETKSSDKEISKLYKKFKKVLKTSTSKTNLEVKLTKLNDEAFKHPLLQNRVQELNKNAAHYTSYKKRKGITQTTSLVDNFLKIVKRKLKQVESFRDMECSKLLFNGMANVRNFFPFLTGAKNAHLSPFMLAQGKTYNLPWIQTMNMHNAFLFTPST